MLKKKEQEKVSAQLQYVMLKTTDQIRKAGVLVDSNSSVNTLKHLQSQPTVAIDKRQG